jgi:hypothetical protein
MSKADKALSHVQDKLLRGLQAAQKGSEHQRKHDSEQIKGAVPVQGHQKPKASVTVIDRLHGITFDLLTTMSEDFDLNLTEQGENRAIARGDCERVRGRTRRCQGRTPSKTGPSPGLRTSLHS